MRFITTLIATLFCVSFTYAQGIHADLGSGTSGSVSGITFSVPSGHNLKMLDGRAVMTGPRSNGQFVAEVSKEIAIQDLTKVATAFTNAILPSETGFAWKLVPSTSILRKSKAERTSGDIKGINPNGTLVELSYVILGIQNKVIVAGTGFQVTKSKVPMKDLFDQDGAAAMSIPDIVVLSHLIASITGEPRSAILPGIFLNTRPANP